MNRYWRLERSSTRSERAPLARASRGSGQSHSLQKLFHFVLLVFIAFRIAWFSLGLVDHNAYEDRPDLLEFALNRGALCAFFTSFTIVFFFWYGFDLCFDRYTILTAAITG